MTFDELLAGMPRQDQSAWAARAIKEWRGRPASDFDLDLGGGLRVPPFFATANGPPDRIKALPSSDERTSGWTQLSDLSSLGGELSMADVMLELEGGAQGFVVDAAQLPALAGAGARVRFDFVQLVVRGGGVDLLTALEQIIPPDQRAHAKVLLLVDFDVDQDSLPEATTLTENWPLLATGLRLSESQSLETTARAALRAMMRLLEAENVYKNERPTPSNIDKVASGTLSVTMPSDYLHGLFLLTALRRLWEQAAQGIGSGSRQRTLEVYVEIRPTRISETSEAYLIDASTRAVAAVSAGVAGLAVTPYTTHEDHRRQARNLQHVLALEANLGGHEDAVAGAQLIERGAELLVDRVWSQHLAKTSA